MLLPHLRHVRLNLLEHSLGFPGLGNQGALARLEGRHDRRHSRPLLLERRLEA